eukprot:1820801-Pyramimonas_sp.AAC.1
MASHGQKRCCGLNSGGGSPKPWLAHSGSADPCELSQYSSITISQRRTSYASGSTLQAGAAQGALLGRNRQSSPNPYRSHSRLSLKMTSQPSCVGGCTSGCSSQYAATCGMHSFERTFTRQAATEQTEEDALNAHVANDGAIRSAHACRGCAEVWRLGFNVYASKSAHAPSA